MLSVFVPAESILKKVATDASAALPENAVWIDLVNPTTAEDKAVEKLAGIAVPTREDMQEIEISSRLYQEEGGVFMTALILQNAETDQFSADVVTFVLAHDRLITIRYIDPQPFRTFAARCERTMVIAPKAEGVLNALLDVIVDRMADVLERAGADVADVFHARCAPPTLPAYRHE